MLALGIAPQPTDGLPGAPLLSEAAATYLPVSGETKEVAQLEEKTETTTGGFWALVRLVTSPARLLGTLAEMICLINLMQLSTPYTRLSQLVPCRSPFPPSEKGLRKLGLSLLKSSNPLLVLDPAETVECGQMFHGSPPLEQAP